MAWLVGKRAHGLAGVHASIHLEEALKVPDQGIAAASYDQIVASQVETQYILWWEIHGGC